MLYTILVVEDDADINNLLAKMLRQADYQVTQVYSGSEAALRLEHESPDLILLDLMLPGLSGEEVLPHLVGVPVIILSAKSETKGKIDLLLAGAADYITKPFDNGELLARIAVQLRQKLARAGKVLTVGALQLDTAAHSVNTGGTPVHLTKTEYAILKLLMQHPGQALAKSTILERISLDTPDCTEASLKQHVSNLRKKLREAGVDYAVVKNWGIGFRLADES